jgi:cytochrome c biogenesis protein CcdA/thiol-disulfide isomerase/thioredoxin
MLPIVLSGGATGGHRRPLGIVTGLVISLTFSTVALVYVLAALGLPNGLMRTLAVVVLLGFGVSLIFPVVAARLEAWLSRLVRLRQRPSGSGFGSGVTLGLGLGVLYAPCAGPILAGVITVSAAQTFTAGRLAVALAYALGSALALYLIMVGGRRFAAPLVRRSIRVQQALGVLMVVVAVLVSTDVDVRFQTAVASRLPGFLVGPAQGLEESKAIKGPLTAARGHTTAEQGGVAEAGSGRRLPVLGRAPEFVGTQRWFNTPGGRPLSIRELTGKGGVVLVDFWTYTCINCIRTFPHLRALDAKYRDAGLTIVGVHSPEFPFEKEAGNVAAAIDQNDLRYPVAQDNDLATWGAFGNQYWPADYLIDASGDVRYVHFGEGAYEESEAAVRSLLAESGAGPLGGRARFRAERPSPGVTTPETYLGSTRAEGFANGRIRPGIQDFGSPPSHLSRDQLAYGGRWQITGESATADAGARLELDFGARRVFLVLGSSRGARRMRVLLDGRPVPGRLAGEDVHGGVATIRRQRLYRLVELPRSGRHTLSLEPAAGIAGYAFTFG